MKFGNEVDSLGIAEMEADFSVEKTRMRNRAMLRYFAHVSIAGLILACIFMTGFLWAIE